MFTFFKRVKNEQTRFESKVDEQTRFEFKIGEQVRIKKYLIVGETYGMRYPSNETDFFTERMVDFRGKRATITDIFNGKYRLDIDSVHYYTDEMLKACRELNFI